MCCSREHYPAVAKEWTASCSWHHKPWPPVNVVCSDTFASGDSCVTTMVHAHLTLDDEWMVCVRPGSYLDANAFEGTWEDWPVKEITISKFGGFKVGRQRTNFRGADIPVATMGQAVLWVTEGDCLQRAGYLPETPSYAEWLKLGTIVEAR